MSVTINDIAEEVGVSRGTVDRVLNHRGRVSEETIKKVEEAARRMGYEKSPAGTGLAARKKKFQLGFVCIGEEKAAFHQAVLAAARKKAQDLSGYGVTVHFFVLRNPADTPALAADIREHPEINGFAVPGIYVSLLYDVWNEEGWTPVPVVTYNLDCEDPGKRLCFVGCDYEKAGRIACGLAALMSGEKSSILLMTEDPGHVASSSVRERGFRKELQNYPAMKIKETLKAEEGCSLSSGRFEEEAERILRENPDIGVVYLLNPGDYTVCDAIRRAAGERRMIVITNDLVSPQQRQMLEDGRITATIDQEPARQGSQPLEILFNYLAAGRKPQSDWEKCRLSIIIKQNMI